ncbi:IclR family transcriptional regulator [Plantactinospora solaniradicis]|uniref:IclR family transcriptional regulator n=1 Tax=Plantactinospora solaniradicis TaxID=1723736 RepID=A0ABW1KB51_9ACTN
MNAESSLPGPGGGARGEHQNIARAALVLEALAGAGRPGLRLTDVINETGLTKTVAHRFLGGLVANGMARLDRSSGRYFLGDRIFTWAVRGSDHFELAERVSPHLRALAVELHDTVYFYQRRDDHAICLGRAEGDFPIKTLTLNIGDRRPLGAGSGSLAIVAYLPDEEIQRLTTEQAENYATYHLTADRLREDILLTRENGYALNVDRLIPGMSGIGIPIRTQAGEPVAAVSVVAISPRLAGDRRTEVARRLGGTIATIESELHGVIEGTSSTSFWRAG